jgi:glycosyltransferase involved in cell wall biosynthesis
LVLLELLILKKLIRCRRLAFVTWENIRMPYLLPFAMIRRLTLKHADGAIAGNSAAADILRAAGFQKTVGVFPLTATDVARFTPARSGDLRQALHLTGFTIGYVGRLVPEKGVASLLQALSQLSGDWQGLIVGRGPQKPELEALAQRLGIADRLRWIDTIAYQDTPRYYNAMDACVVPSLTAPRWKEQFGRVLAEAMACEVPVVGSDSGSIPEVIGDAGCVFPEGDSSALAQHLMRLQGDAALRHTLGQRGRQRIVDNYSNERIAARVVAFWREVSAS